MMDAITFTLLAVINLSLWRSGGLRLQGSRASRSRLGIPWLHFGNDGAVCDETAPGSSQVLGVGLFGLSSLCKEGDAWRGGDTHHLPGWGALHHDGVILWGLFPDVVDPRVPFRRDLGRVVLVLRVVDPTLAA